MEPTTEETKEEPTAEDGKKEEEKPTTEDDGKKQEEKPTTEDGKKEEAADEEEEMVGEFSFEGRNPKLIKAAVSMISGCHDIQYSADVGADTTAKFKLTDPAGLRSGAITSTFLNVFSQFEGQKPSRLDFIQTVRKEIKEKAEATQVPVFSASTKVDMDQPFEFVPSTTTGVKRAVVIGINYVHTELELGGCQNDAANIKNYLLEKQGFDEENIVMVMDDGQCISPTKWNILSELNKMVEASKPGDHCFMFYSGHGSQALDESGDEKDGVDETLCPISGGGIIDDELFDNVVTQLKEGVSMFALIDACHSGTVLDLPYSYRFTEDKENEALQDTAEEDDDEEVEDEDEEEDEEEANDLDDQMMAMTAMLLMMQVNRKMGKNKAEKLKTKMNKMMEFFG